MELPFLCLLCVFGSVGSVLVPLSSNAIKNPEEPDWTENHRVLLEPVQSLSCSADEDCVDSAFCVGGSCLPCRRRRKRCTRDAMCCHGNRCSNGVCLSVDSDLQHFVLDTPVSSVNSSTRISPEEKPELLSQQLQPRALDGERCLRSSDCADGLCCARHFWSKICKPVLTEGQVCSRRRRKGALGLEIFQRCDCGAGLTCRAQDEAELQRLNKAARSLHTCQH